MATAAFLANSVANSVSADGVLKWIDEIAASRPMVRRPDFSTGQIAKILQNKKARDIIYHLVANTRSRGFQVETIGNLYLQKRLASDEIAFWRDRLPELELPATTSAAVDQPGSVSTIEPQAARHLIKKQNALREVEQLFEQLMNQKIEISNLSKKASTLDEKRRAVSSGNCLRQNYLEQIDEKSEEWLKMTNELRRRLVSAGARSTKMSLKPGLERVSLAAAELGKVGKRLSENILDDDVAVLRLKNSNHIPSEVCALIQTLASDYTVGELGAALLSNLNRACLELEAELDRSDPTAEIKALMFDYDPTTNELRDTNPLVTQPASEVMAALTLERESALLKVSSEAAEARIDIFRLKNRYEEQFQALNGELKRWLKKDATILNKLQRYVEIASQVAGFEQAEKAMASCSQSIEAEIRELELRNRQASMARSKLASFQKNLEHQIGLIRRLLESAASMKKEHEQVLAQIEKVVSNLPRSKSPVLSEVRPMKEAIMEELNDFRTKNLSALYWGFNASAYQRFLSTVGELFGNLPNNARIQQQDFCMKLLYQGPSDLLSSIRDDILLYKCRLILQERLEKVCELSKSIKYDESIVRDVIDQHNAIAQKNWDCWNEELSQASRDCNKALEEDLHEFRALVHDWRLQPGQFAADWVQLDGLTYREYYKNVTFLTDSLRQRQEISNSEDAY